VSARLLASSLGQTWGVALLGEGAADLLAGIGMRVRLVVAAALLVFASQRNGARYYFDCVFSRGSRLSGTIGSSS